MPVTGQQFDSAWAAWCRSGSRSSSAPDPWAAWCRQQDTEVARHAAQATAAAEERRRSEQRVAESQRSIAEDRARRAEADRRAQELLDRHLTEEQRQSIQRHRHFHLHTPEGRRYRVDVDQQARNVHLVDESGRVRETYCAHPAGVPTADAVLAQKLMLETNEREFLRIANRS